jgi:hypothetical protein
MYTSEILNCSGVCGLVQYEVVFMEEGVERPRYNEQFALTQED